MNECAVAIVGAGPVGMMLAAELALAGVEVALLERRPDHELAGSRAGGLQSRTIEVFDQRGIAERFLELGRTAQVQAFGRVTLDISDFPTRHPYGLGLWQNRIEGILAEWLGELGVSIRYGSEVTGVEPDETGVSVLLADGHPLRAQFVVGCDGGRSVVRKAAGIEFAGWDASVSNLVAEVEYGVEPEWGMREDGGNSNGIGPLAPGSDCDTIRVVVTEREVTPGAGEPTLGDLSEAMRAVWGTDFGVHSPTWISRFTDAARQATSYRAGRILLAGDAAHVHYPAGGQGLNIGVQDAVNLGWKLAQVVSGVSPEPLLDTYDAERRPIAAQVLQDTLAQVGLRRPDERSKAVASAVAELLSLDEGRKRFGARLSGLGVHYEFGAVEPGGEHPLLGRRMPDLSLLVGDDSVRTFTLLHSARPVLLNFGAPLPHDVAPPWADRVQLVDAEYAGVWELPELGLVHAPSAVLVRPDGYVAWVGVGALDDVVSPSRLVEALTRWFGAR